MTISYPGLMTREGVPILYRVGGGATIGAIRLGHLPINVWRLIGDHAGVGCSPTRAMVSCAR
jgi:hypothetical protein